MKTLLAIGLLFCALISPAIASDFKQIQLTDFANNNAIDLHNFEKSKPTYIKFWATWCQPCMQQMPHFQSINEKYSDKINILAINININEDSQYIKNVISKFALTMPILLDNEGQLAVALGLVGTPFSVLINTDDDIVYTTHESDKILDTFLDKLAQGQKLKSANAELLTKQKRNEIIAPWNKGEHLLFFSATWCDWYLEDSRPEMAKECKNIQSNINALHDQSKNLPWHGFVNHLWTDQKALLDFTDLYNIQIPFDIDAGGVLFNHFNIRKIPTMIKIENGNETNRWVGEEILKSIIR